MIGNVSSSEGTRLQGFIELEKINKKDNVRETYKNTITNGGKQYFLHKSASAMMNMSADVFGTTVCSNTISRVGYSGNSNPAARLGRSDRDITNVLLNIPDEAFEGLGANTSFINVWDANMATADKVIGYANNNLVPTADGKEGIVDFCKGDYMADPFTIAKRWKYDETVANGTFNVIAMMPASVIKQNSGDGVKFSKCIDKVNTQYINYVSMSTGFLIPGIPGYTANNEILLNFSKDGISKWKYNIDTGEIAQVPDTDNFFIPTAYNNGTIVDMQYIDNYLYVLTLSGISSQYTYVDVYDPSNNMTKLTNFNCSGLNYDRNVKASIFKYNNSLYVSTISEYVPNETSSARKIWKLTVGSGGYATASGTVFEDFSDFPFTLPSGFEYRTIGIGAYGNNYIMYNYIRMWDDITSPTKIEGSQTGYKMVGYVFTDMTDPAGSIIDMICGVCPNEVLFNNAAHSGSLRVGYDMFNSYTKNVLSPYDSRQQHGIVMNNSNPQDNASLTYDNYKTGVFLTLDKWWTNVISLVKLNTPITKTESDIIYVSYGYKIV